MSNHILKAWLLHLAAENGTKFSGILEESDAMSLEDIVLKFDLKRKTRKPIYIDSRYFFYWFCAVNLKLTEEKIASYVDFNRSMISYGKKKAQQLMEVSDFRFFENTKEIRRELEKIKNLNRWVKIY